jgi:hypothetical protein
VCVVRARVRAFVRTFVNLCGCVCVGALIVHSHDCDVNNEGCNVDDDEGNDKCKDDGEGGVLLVDC